MDIGKLERVPLAEVGWHEAHDFTVWLQENIDSINEITDLQLSSADREQHAGSYRADLVAESVDGSLTVIENQLTRSDHDHLGKLLTYLSNFDASAAVWIVSDPRPEHVSAINWLNESSSASFYLVKVEAVRISDSVAAPLLTLIVGPSEATREIGMKKKELAERHVIRHEFWTGLLERAKQRTSLHASISPSHENWVATGAGIAGLTYVYVIRKNADSNVEIYIDRGKNAEELNLQIFDHLAASKSELEEKVGEELNWERLEDRRACRIKLVVENSRYDDREGRSEIYDRMVDAMIRLEEAFRDPIRNLKLR